MSEHYFDSLDFHDLCTYLCCGGTCRNATCTIDPHVHHDYPCRSLEWAVEANRIIAGAAEITANIVDIVRPSQADDQGAANP